MRVAIGTQTRHNSTKNPAYMISEVPSLRWHSFGRCQHGELGRRVVSEGVEAFFQGLFQRYPLSEGLSEELQAGDF